jgi:predicted metal-dependent hydrolase
MQLSFDGRLHAALDLYNRGEYLEAQEALERLHDEADGDAQSLLRAMAILATAMHLHFRRGGGRGVINLLRQFLMSVEGDRRERFGIDVAQLAEAVEAYLADLQERRKAGAGFFDRWLVPKVSYLRVTG